MWIPSHIGIVGNEKVDKYSDRSTKSIINSKINSTSINHVEYLFKKCFSNSKTTGFQYQPKINVKKTFKNLFRLFDARI